MPAAGEALIGTLRNNPAAGGAAGAGNGSLASIAGGDEEAARLLSLAAAQRMSTDVRRAVFMAVMGSEDAGEAFERLTRLPLKVSHS
jgi:nucleolar MIF4G domain-containing protein 1